MARIIASQTTPTGFCWDQSIATFTRLFPALKWESFAGSAAGTIIPELENRRSTITLAPVPFEDLPMLARGGWVRPLDPWFTPEQLSIYSPQALALATVERKLYAIPDDITPFVFFIRAAVLERLGVNPPRT